VAHELPVFGAWDLLRALNIVVGLTVVAYTTRSVIIAKRPPAGWRWSMCALCAAGLTLDVVAFQRLGHPPSWFTLASLIVLGLSFFGAASSSPRDFRPHTRPWEELQARLDQSLNLEAGFCGVDGCTWPDKHGAPVRTEGAEHPVRSERGQ
jgi:hypothetical protein